MQRYFWSFIRVSLKLKFFIMIFPILVQIAVVCGGCAIIVEHTLPPGEIRRDVDLITVARFRVILVSGYLITVAHFRVIKISGYLLTVAHFRVTLISGYLITVAPFRVILVSGYLITVARFRVILVSGYLITVAHFSFIAN